MSNIKFDQDAVSENIRNLISQGIGSIQDGVPSFNNADIQLHQQMIRRERGLSPISATAPTGINVNTQALDFTGLNNPDAQGLRDLVIKIGELEGRKSENSAKIATMLQNEPGVMMADEVVSTLSAELAMVSLDKVDIRNEIQGELVQATQLAKIARDDALVRAGIQEKRDNNLIDADIVKLQAQQQVLQTEQDRQDQARDRRAFPDVMLKTVVEAGISDGLDNADKFLRSSPRVTQEMVRRLATGQSSKNYLEAYDNIIDLGGRKAGENMIVNGAPVEEQDNVRIALKQNAERMAIARKQANDQVTAEAVRDASLRGNEKAIAERANQIYDGMMRDATFGGYERVLLATKSDELDASWFDNNTELLEVGKLIMDMVPPDADNMESAFAVVGQRLITQGIDRDLMLRAMGKIIDSRVTSWNTTNRFLGLSVSREKLKNKTQAISFNIFNLDRIDKSRRQAAESVQAGDAANIGALGLFGLSELDQAEASGLGVNTPVPEGDAEETAADIRQPFQSPNLPGLVPSDASRERLQQLARSIVTRAQRQSVGGERTAPSTALTPAEKKKEAEMQAIIKQFAGSPDDLQRLAEKISDQIRQAPRNRRVTTPGVRG